jgi:hypothetical protein
MAAHEVRCKLERETMETLTEIWKRISKQKEGKTVKSVTAEQQRSGSSKQRLTHFSKKQI